jgi:hypothetical protein
MKSSFKILILIYCLAVTAIIISCNPEDCLEGAGSKGEKTIQTGFYKVVYVNGIFDVLLVQDTTCFIRFEGGENLLEQANASNTDSVVWIDNNSNCYFLKDYEKIKVYLHFNKISEIRLKEACSVKSVNPITNTFTMTAEGQVTDIDIELNNEHFFFYNNKTSGGKFVFRGWCNHCSIMGFYSGKVDASDLNTNTMKIENHSVTDYLVRAQETVHAKIFNSGNIYVYGKPEIIIDSLAGSGKVIRVNEP